MVFAMLKQSFLCFLTGFFLLMLSNPHGSQASTAVYYCPVTGKYSIATGNPRVVEVEAMKKCRAKGGRVPSKILYIASRGYGALAIGKNQQGKKVIGATAGQSSKDKAKKMALMLCKRKGAKDPDIEETWYDETGFRGKDLEEEKKKNNKKPPIEVQNIDKDILKKGEVKLN